MAELTREPPPTLSARIINRLTPPPEESRNDDHWEAA
jgi:hypothetical protein